MLRVLRSLTPVRVAVCRAGAAACVRSCAWRMACAVRGCTSLANSDGQPHDQIAMEPFPQRVAAILQRPLTEQEIDVRPNGYVFLPDPVYRRILNEAFGPNGWRLEASGPLIVQGAAVTGEWTLYCMNRFVSVARGEIEWYPEPKSVSELPADALEAVQAIGLLRCCKDLGVASELWDPVFANQWRQRHAVQVYAEHMYLKQRRRVWRKKTGVLLPPWRESPTA